MALSTFDKYFLHLPPFDRENDFFTFWEKSIKEIKKIPIEPVIKKNNRKSSQKFTVFDVKFKGFTKTTISGDIHIPNAVEKPKIIIHVHDYNNVIHYPQQLLDDSIAYFFITLRGHDILPEITEEEVKSPGYMIENILDIDTYYVKAVYLDIYRSIDMLRLMPNINCKTIGIIGKGLGAAAALFATTFSNRIDALVLETPSFCYLPLSQNISESSAAIEINQYLSAMKGKTKQIKRNLSYFDAINFSDRIICPVLATVGFKDTISPPECIFALFNHLLCDKTIEVYPEEGNVAGGNKQFQKSIKWLIQKLNENNI